MARFTSNRLDAALRLERARQIARENTRYGYPVTQQHVDAIHAAEHDYDQATALVRP